MNIFLLGAGASVPADIPDTKRFIYGKLEEGMEGFKEYISKKGSENEKKVLEILLKKLEGKFGKDNIDLERVLETMTDLNNLESNILPEFFEEKKFSFNQEDTEDLKNLEKGLRRFIREKTIVTGEKIDYLEPLRVFRPLKIYSVNYDTCIEQFCKKYSLQYTDGFELYWHPEFFDDEKYDVKHCKLHGSVMWWLISKNTYVKIPIRLSEETIELITGERAENVIIYPVPGKADYARPLNELKTMLYEDLSQADVCIVIGYSFRDESIKQIFFEAAERNKDLAVILISPSAGETYNEQLKFKVSDDGLSSLERRVFCFNYPIETVLRTGYLLRSLRTIEEIKSIFETGEESKKSEKDEWVHQYADCVMKYAEIGNVDMAKTILELYLGLSLENLDMSDAFGDSGKRFKLYYMMGMSLLLDGNKAEAAEFFQKLHSILKKSFDDVQIVNKQIEIEKALYQERDVLHLDEDWKPIRKNESRIRELEEHLSRVNDQLKNIQIDPDSSFWCEYKSKWGCKYFYEWVQFLKTQVTLLGRTRSNLVSEHLDPLMESSDKIWEIIEKPPEIKRRLPIIPIGGLRIEIERKEEAEKYYEQMLKCIQGLIDFLREE